MDAGYSALKTQFASAGFEFAYNQTELGWRLAMTDRVLDAWCETTRHAHTTTATADAHCVVSRPLSLFLAIALALSAQDPRTLSLLEKLKEREARAIKNPKASFYIFQYV